MIMCYEISGFQKCKLITISYSTELHVMELEDLISLEGSRNWNTFSDSVRQTEMNRLGNIPSSLSVEIHKCTQCEKTYARKQGLNYHLKWECGKEPQFFCNICTYKTHRKGNLFRHISVRHNFRPTLNF